MISQKLLTASRSFFLCKLYLCAGERARWRMAQEAHEKEGNDEILYLDYGGDYTTMSKCEELENSLYATCEIRTE